MTDLPVADNRIDRRFAALRADRVRGMVAYITAGDPTLDRTVELATELERVGVDVLELGVPFSDPLADGRVNQLAAQRALESGTTVAGILDAVRRIRDAGVEIPIILFSYLNPLLRYGIDRLMVDSADAGVDGFLLLDLPPEEGDETLAAARAHGLHLVFLLAPTSPADRVATVAARAGGFIYYVSREGVTGMQKQLNAGLGPQVRRVRRACRPVPVVVGFGISTPAQAAAVAELADAVVVGSAIVDRIGRIGDDDRLIPSIGRFVRGLARAVHGACSTAKGEKG